MHDLEAGVGRKNRASRQKSAINVLECSAPSERGVIGDRTFKKRLEFDKSFLEGESFAFGW
jgi:hypothetical protein